mgnify:CR=1 FL=1
MIDFNKHFEYRGGKLYNKTTRASRAIVGMESGCVGVQGYRRVVVDSMQFLTHRVVWEMFNGAIAKDLQVDHINHNKTDNRVENLRLVTVQGNAKNQTISSRNKSGIQGVCWDKSNKNWRVQIYAEGKNKFLGRFDNLELAGLVIEEAREKYGFHKNHGVSL